MWPQLIDTRLRSDMPAAQYGWGGHHDSSAISFGPFTLDLASKRLLRDGVEIKVRPQAFQALRALAAHGGRIVEHDQLIAEAWSGTSVSRHTVDVTIAEVRKILGDCGSWIRRQPKGGYRLLTPKSDMLVRLGWHFLNQRSRDGFGRALECFHEAAAEAPRDHRAWEGQAVSYLMMASFGVQPGSEMAKQFHVAHERAVALVGLTPELRCNYAHAIHMYERRLDESLAEFNRAIAEKPTMAVAHVRKALLLVTMGDLDGAVDSAAQARLADPLQPLSAVSEVNVRIWRREYERAVHLGAQAVQLHPYFMLTRAYYGTALEVTGRLREALEQYHLGGVITQGLPWIRGLEAACLVKLGRVGDARAIHDELVQRRKSQYVDAYAMARIQHALGHIDEAFVELERAIDESVGSLYSIRFDPLMDPFRSDSRFPRLLRRYLRGPERRPLTVF